MKKGILKEPEFENRVALTPESVEVLKKLQVDLLLEKGAGEKAFATDKMYEEAGVQVKGRIDLVKEVDIILSINPPEEIEKLRLEFESLMIDDPPLLKKGVTNTLEELAPDYQLGLISNTGVTPGPVISQVLENYGILHYPQTPK